MDLLFLILAILLLVVGLIGCFIPIVPGPPIAYIGILLLHFSSYADFSTSTLLIWLAAVVLIQLVDFIVPIYGLKYFKGSKTGQWSCLIGSLVGLLFFPPMGIIIGPFIGAFLGESLLEHRSTKEAVRAAFGAFIGFIIGTLAKVALCIYFIFESCQLFLS